MRSSIYADIPGVERGRAHQRAARLLATAGAAAERVAAHLLLTHPCGDRETIDVLTEAASESVARGGPDRAVAYLSRPLAEPPATSGRQPLLALLGRAEYLAHQPGASAHLVEAMDGAPTARARGELALQAAKAMIIAEPDSSENAIHILNEAIADLGEPESQMSMRMEAQLLAAAGLKVDAAASQRAARRPVPKAARRRTGGTTPAGQPRRLDSGRWPHPEAI